MLHKQQIVKPKKMSEKNVRLVPVSCKTCRQDIHGLVTEHTAVSLVICSSCVELIRGRTS